MTHDITTGIDDERWLDVGSVDDITRRKRVVVDGDDRPVLVLAHGGNFFAMDNICIHRQRELSKGVVLNGRLVCPGHQWAFELGSGWEAVKEQCQPTYTVRVADGRVAIDLASRSPSPDPNPDPDPTTTPTTTTPTTPILTASKRGLDIGIVTRDVEAALAFYVDVVGLDYVEKLEIPWGPMHRLRFGDSWLKIVLQPGASAPQHIGLDGAVGIRYLTLEIDNIDEVWERVTASGARVFHPLAPFGDTPIRMGMVFDPDGNVVELLHRPRPATSAPGDGE